MNSRKLGRLTPWAGTKEKLMSTAIKYSLESPEMTRRESNGYIFQVDSAQNFLKEEASFCFTIQGKKVLKSISYFIYPKLITQKMGAKFEYNYPWAGAREIYMMRRERDERETNVNRN